MEKKLWYAVENDPEDADWGYGSYDLDEAKRMAKKSLKIYPKTVIAVIEEGPDPECVDIITDFDD